MDVPLAGSEMGVPGAKPASHPAGRAPGKVLIVEDDPDIRESLQTVLELEGYEVLTAPDGRAALDLVERDCPRVAVVDIGLPDLDGYEVARRIREKYSANRPHLIALTGYNYLFRILRF